MADVSKPVTVQVGVPHTGADPLGSAVPQNVKDELNKTADAKERERKANEPHNPIMDKKPMPPSEGLKLGPETLDSDEPGGGRKENKVDAPGMDRLDPAKKVVPGGQMLRRPGEKHRKP